MGWRTGSPKLGLWKSWVAGLTRGGSAVTGIRDNANDRESLKFELWEQRRYESDAGMRETPAVAAAGRDNAADELGLENQKRRRCVRVHRGDGGSGTAWLIVLVMNCELHLPVFWHSERLTVVG
ncbi:hypothetical protein M0R45_036354 [Rubus argutus]|uniref:Uncharacterized protein n=1 Tax=Rubus argutus TaxID=59490 RepID=A0AAW1VZF5_RUBAR